MRQVVGLVGHADDRRVDIAQPPGDFLIQRRQARPGVDDEQNHRGRFDGGGDLLFDLGGQIVGILETDAAGVDDLEITFRCGKADSSAGRA